MTYSLSPSPRLSSDLFIPSTDEPSTIQSQTNDQTTYPTDLSYQQHQPDEFSYPTFEQAEMTSGSGYMHPPREPDPSRRYHSSSPPPPNQQQNRNLYPDPDEDLWNAPLPDITDPDNVPFVGQNPKSPTATMPSRGDRRAPTFEPVNEPASILRFFDDIRHYGANAGLNDKEMIAWARFYAPLDDELLWQQLKTARGSDFDAFRREVLTYYPTAFRRYTIGDLLNLTKDYAADRYWTSTTLGNYYRDFMRVSGYLMSIEHISKLDQRRYFRDGIPAFLNDKLEHSLRFVDYTHPPGLPWNIQDVFRELERILSGGEAFQQEPQYNRGYTRRQTSEEPRTTWHRSSPPYESRQHPNIHGSDRAPKQEDVLSLLVQEIRGLREDRVPAYQNGPPRARQFDCSMCGSPAHSFRNCADRDRLLNRRVFKLDDRGFVILPNGERLPKGNPGECIIQRANQYFQQHPELLPPGITVPIERTRDLPPHQSANVYEAVYPPYDPYDDEYDDDPVQDLADGIIAYANAESPPPEPYATPDVTFEEAPEIFVTTRARAQQGYYGRPQTNRYNPPNRPTEAYNARPRSYAEDPRPTDDSDKENAPPVTVLRHKKNPIEANPRPPSPQPPVQQNVNREPLKEKETQPPAAPESRVVPTAGRTNDGPAVPRQIPDSTYPKIHPRPQYKQIIPAADPQAVKDVFDKIMDAEITVSVKQLMAASPELRKKNRDFITGKREITPDNPQELGTIMYSATNATADPNKNEESVAPANVRLRTINLWINGTIQVKGLLDTGASFIALSRTIWMKLGCPTLADKAISAETADGSVSRSLGLIPKLRVSMDGFTVLVQAQVVHPAPFELLLGRPFFTHTKAHLVEEDDDQQILYLTDPDRGTIVAVPTQERFPHAPTNYVLESDDPEINLSEDEKPTTRISFDRRSIDVDAATIPHRITSPNRIIPNPTSFFSTFYLPSVFDNESLIPRIIGSMDRNTDRHPIFKYKKVADRIKPIPATLPEDFRIVRNEHPDPIRNLPQLPTHPPPFDPGIRFTQERKDALEIDPVGFLTPDEKNLGYWIIRQQEEAFAWDESEKGSLIYEYFAPVLIPTVEHIPWVLKNIPIPPGIFKEVVGIIKDKIASGVYEPSNSSYRSRWFCVLKKDGKSLRLVHDLQPLNAVTTRDPSVPYPTEHIAESFGARACYTTLDLFVAFDQRKLDVRSRDLTTFQTPLGAYRLTSIPMGYTNSQQIMHADVTFMLKDEIPDVTFPYVDDVPIKGPESRYECLDGSFETIPENPNIRRFIWEHFNDVNRVLQRLKVYGATVSGKKIVLGAPEAVILGHTCNYEGRIPDAKRIRTLIDWPPLDNIHQTRAFLGTAGVIRHFIPDFARTAAPITRLLRKDRPFNFDEEAQAAMNNLKEAIANSNAIRPINYESKLPVILCVDSSTIGYGAIIFQEDEHGVRHPCRFMSGTWNDRERNYSQPKIELFGLFRALYEARVYLIGINDLTIEVDAKYIKGMINNPDLQPNATINRWIAGILLFSFKLKHIPASRHIAPDGLSRREPDPSDPPRDEGFEGWIDRQYAFTLDNAPEETTDTDASSGPQIPRSEKAAAADKWLESLKTYLDSMQTPDGLDDKQLRNFVNRASKFYTQDSRLMRKNYNGPPQVVLAPDKRYAVLRTAHDDLGHKGFFTVRSRILDRFWWPMMNADIHWYTRSCHECQVRQFTRIKIPPTIPTPAPLFGRVHIDVMLMPRSGTYRYIVQARDSLSAYPEFRLLTSDNSQAIAKFIFQEIICRWGCVHEIITDNGASFAKDLPPLLAKYNVQHVRISPYNSRANGIVERRHLDLREVLMKLAGNRPEKWSNYAYHAIWAERVSIQRSTGYSPYYIVHGVEPTLPFDLAEQTYISPVVTGKLTHKELIAIRARALQRRPEDLNRVKDRVLQARFRSIQEFEKRFQHTIRDYNFAPGALVLVRNSQIELELNRKAKPRYLGPMVVVRRTRGGAYILAEPTGAISALRYAAFRVIPYHARTSIIPDIESFVSKTTRELDRLAAKHTAEAEGIELAEEIDEDDDPGDQSEEEPPDLDPISDSEASTDHDDPDSLPDDQDSGSEY